MYHGICQLAALPVRISPSDKDEMINQLLFGEEFSVLEEKEEWIRIKGGYDNYTGWIDKRGALEISGKTFLDIKQNNNTYVPERMVLLTRFDGTKMLILPGSSLPLFNSDSLILDIENKKFLFDEHPQSTQKSLTVTEVARLFLNAPYLLGGRSLFGIDCSGFTQVVYKIKKVKISRDASQQAKEGVPVNNLNLSAPGDLAFFGDDEDHIKHVGIIIENNRIIHVSGRVLVDKIDEKGILNIENNSYSHYLKKIRRFINI